MASLTGCMAWSGCGPTPRALDWVGAELALPGPAAPGVEVLTVALALPGVAFGAMLAAMVWSLVELRRQRGRRRVRSLRPRAALPVALAGLAATAVLLAGRAL